MKEFELAGAYLGVVTPALSSSDIDPVNFTVRYIERLASNINGNGDISINGETVQFTSANFLKLIQSTEVSIYLRSYSQMYLSHYCSNISI